MKTLKAAAKATALLAIAGLWTLVLMVSPKWGGLALFVVLFATLTVALREDV